MLDDRDQLLIAQLTALCRKTSAVILSYYGDQERLDIQTKANDTPLTQADLAAHDLLITNLPSIIDLPVISEESDGQSQLRRHSDYWLIDPIDGTREFIEQTDGFCIAIARIVNHRPVLGYIFSPTSNEFWFALNGKGAYKGIYPKTSADKHPIAQAYTFEKLRCRPIHTPITIITARRTLRKRMEAYLERSFGEYQHKTAGSALKFCHIVEGYADIYPKTSAATSEWDIAAGDILLHEAGGGLRLADGSIPRYGYNDTTLNPPFLAYGAELSEDTIKHYCALLRDAITQT
ncbi:3'(2'),5'-bisphosphate nucleotidase CysQ [Cardiobacteriaceae bacterium TAE3-ERU3]|nr:3'(2'),5'-bisphosphate nucleotidase CysQ [Cardiobacteriaceae bacterium TAE3-ERU3]